jgi:hypothetical protein
VLDLFQSVPHADAVTARDLCSIQRFVRHADGFVNGPAGVQGDGWAPFLMSEVVLMFGSAAKFSFDPG